MKYRTKKKHKKIEGIVGLPFAHGDYKWVRDDDRTWHSAWIDWCFRYSQKRKQIGHVNLARAQKLDGQRPLQKRLAHAKKTCWVTEGYSNKEVAEIVTAAIDNI